MAVGEGVGPCWVRRVPRFERVPGRLPAPGQTVPVLGRQPALAVIQASQWSPSILKVLGILCLNIGAPGLGCCCGEGQYVDLSASPVTCVTVVFKAMGSFLRGAASQAKHGQVGDSDESCTCRVIGVKISYKISCLKRSGERPFRLAGC